MDNHDRPAEEAFPEFPDCFVCGRGNPFGLQTRFRRDGRGTRASFTAEARHAGYERIVHGGIISSLLDEALVWASFAYTGRFGVTAEITVRFLESMLIGKTYTVTGAVTRQKGRLTLAEAAVTDETGVTVAEAQGKVVSEKE
ncbi:PaaI family thioesterase [bacterium]|nr:PaaI family thioesterase [bacterium]